jgi:glyoxylase-like metal-dependent hydrolase (beta-lactamase superfamily II)
MFTGGNLETNSYLIPCPEGNILVDAPEGSAAAFEQKKVSLLLLTHGHFDHVWDAASLAARQECPVVMHSVTQDIVNDRNLLRRIGLDLEVTPVTATSFLSEGQITLLGKTFSIFEVPGHCPGSICLYDSQDGLLYGGDVLFAGGVGRWDLPGGDRDLLIGGIRSKLLPLPPETVVLPGHGPSTTIGREKTSNPYLQ